MTRSIRLAALAVTLCVAAVVWQSRSAADRPAPTPAAAAAPATPEKLKTQSIKIDAERFFEAGFDMVQLPPGKITLKADNGTSRTYFIKPIWIGTREVQWAEYDIFWQKLDVPDRDRRALIDARSRPSTPYAPPDGGYGHDGYPAGKVNFVAAQQYVAWLSQRTGRKFRLPTEAEWEYACRAGAAGPVAPRPNDLDRLAWHAENSSDQPHAVAKKTPNPWGLYDMLGNVAEFVTIDPTDARKIAAYGTYAAAGGSFFDEAEDVHSGAREPYTPRWQRSDPQEPKGKGWLSDAPHVGLRVVMED